MGRTKVGVIGLGHAANSFHLPCLSRFGDVELVLCDAWAEPLAQACRQWGVPTERAFDDVGRMLASGVDAVYLLVPQYALHGRQATPYEAYAMQCLQAGKPVFVEKPLGVDRSQAQRLTSAAKRLGVTTTMCGFQRRFNPLLRYALKRVRERGPLLQCSFSFFKGMICRECSEEATHENYDWLTLDLVHCLDLARWVPGADLVNFVHSKRAYPAEQKVDSEFHAMATFSNGVTSFFSSNVRVGHRILRFELHGVGISVFITSEPNDGTVPEDKGTSHHDMVATIYALDGRDPYASLPKPEIVHAYEVAPEKSQQALAGFYGEDRHFVDCVRERRRTECEFDDACLTIDLCERIVKDERAAYNAI